MKATRKEMRAEALERMKALKLSDKIVEAFAKENRLMISDQYAMGRDSEYTEEVKNYDAFYLTHKGVVWSLYASAPSEETLAKVREAEKRYKALVYHIHRLEMRKDMILYAFLAVEGNREDWENARRGTAMGMPYCAAPVLGYDDALEYSMLPVAPIWGCLIRTD